MSFTSLTEFFGRHRVMRFLLSGGTALLVNLVLLYVFADMLNMWYITASILAFVGAFCVSFFLQKFWTFDNKNMDSVHFQAGISLVVALANLALNTLIMYELVEGLGVYHIFAQVIASGVIACESFFVYKNLVFNVRPTAIR